ncbi:MerR family transcriptional regulator [Bacillus sp. AFS002410]|uniref:MerR family transcriptional regulator n=1 Tax=Bacillus sp. AFS002410 TaxID=2033481 RepID=UPI000BF058D0|nr:MerR family transcriptional regulator [Bacillus sp. AFS002410]PEJ56534.1 MerR family transcriptional regulator [Bacillus sp. AFS002410]
MRLTVKDLSSIAGISIKTLYHYHKIGLLIPFEIGETGYRYYSLNDLDRLQEILFYKELDFPLLEIKKLLVEESNRSTTLEKQLALLEKKINRYEQLIQTVKTSLNHVTKGEKMEKNLMFKGFEREEDWKNALEEQNSYLEETYNVALDVSAIDVERMNLMAIEAQNFQVKMADFLKTGVKFNDPIVQKVASTHIQFLNKNGHVISKEDFVNQTKFFLHDNFHRDLLENQQVGLSYYLVAVAENL